MGQGQRMWTRFIWLWIGTGGRILWIWYWTFDFHTRIGISCLDKWSLARNKLPPSGSWEHEVISGNNNTQLSIIQYLLPQGSHRPPQTTSFEHADGTPFYQCTGTNLHILNFEYEITHRILNAGHKQYYSNIHSLNNVNFACWATIHSENSYLPGNFSNKII